MRVTPGSVSHPLLRLASGQPNARPAWTPGQTVQAEVLGVRDNLVRLGCGGDEFWAEWPGALPHPGEHLELHILGQQQGVWQMELLSSMDHTGIFLPTLLEQLGLELTPESLQQLRRHLSGDQPGDVTDNTGLCRLDESAWQRLFGFVPQLAPLFLAWQPLPCGLLIGRPFRDGSSAADADANLCWLLAVDLDRLGPVRVVGTGAWPRFDLQLSAGQEAMPWLRKTESELRQTLTGLHMQIASLAYQVTERPILSLPTRQSLLVSGVDVRL